MLLVIYLKPSRVIRVHDGYCVSSCSQCYHTFPHRCPRIVNRYLVALGFIQDSDVTAVNSSVNPISDTPDRTLFSFRNLEPTQLSVNIPAPYPLHCHDLPDFLFG